MKFFGSILILCACVVTCVLYERSEKQKLSYLSSVCDFIKNIKAQIEYFSSPTEKIFSSYEPKTDLIADLITKKDVSMYFEAEDCRIVEDFFNSLGKGMKDEELCLCSYTISELEKRIEKKRIDYPNKIKVFRAMTFFSGICVIILLI